MVEDWYASVGEDVMFAAMLDKAELTEEVKRTLLEYWSSLEVVHSRFLEFFALTHPPCSTTPRDIYDWIQQLEEEQYWSELYEWSLNFHTALVSMSNTLQTPDEEQVQSYDASLFIDSSSTSARTENGSGGKKYYSFSPEKWARPASFASSRKAPSLGSSHSGYDSPIESAGYWARNSPSTMFEDLLTGRSHTTMLSPLTAAFDEPYCSPSSNTSAESEHIPRPPNAFLIFRSDYCREHKGERRVQGHISKITGAAWKSLTPAEIHHWQKKASEAAERHKLEHPGYRFRPQRNKKDNLSTKKKGRKRP